MWHAAISYLLSTLNYRRSNNTLSFLPLSPFLMFHFCPFLSFARFDTFNLVFHAYRYIAISILTDSTSVEVNVFVNQCFSHVESCAQNLRKFFIFGMSEANKRSPVTLVSIISIVPSLCPLIKSCDKTFTYQLTSHLSTNYISPSPIDVPLPLLLAASSEFAELIPSFSSPLTRRSYVDLLIDWATLHVCRTHIYYTQSHR